MTVDERIEKLAERHEALAQTAEMLLHDQQQTQKVMQQAGEMITGLADSMAQLARIVQAHEQRLEHLEGGA